MNESSIERFSYSKLSLYENCPYQYKRVYVDGVEQPISWHLSLGLAAADIIQVAHEKGFSNLEQLVEDHFIPVQYVDIVNSSKDKYFQVLGYESESHMNKQKENLIRYLKDFFQKYFTEKLFGVEVPFSIKIDDFELTGRIDMLEKQDDNSLAIIDNKLTSRYIDDVFNSIQLGIYYQAVKRLLPRFSISKVGYYYLMFAKEISIDSSIMNHSGILQRIRNAVSSIRSKKFERRYTLLCRYCHLKEECESL